MGTGLLASSESNLNPDPQSAWELLVGRLILLCGDIELQLLQLHWNLMCGGAAYDGSLKMQSPKEKAKRILKSLDASKCAPALKQEIRRLLSHAIQLGNTRNLIAHNPLSMNVYHDSNGSFGRQAKIRSLRHPEIHISKENLEATIIKASSLREQLYVVVSVVGESAIGKS